MENVFGPTPEKKNLIQYVKEEEEYLHKLMKHSFWGTNTSLLINIKDSVSLSLYYEGKGV